MKSIIYFPFELWRETKTEHVPFMTFIIKLQKPQEKRSLVDRFGGVSALPMLIG